MSNPAIHLMREVENLDGKTIEYLNAESTRIVKIPDQERLKMGNPQPARYADRSNPSVLWVDNSWSRDEWVTLDLLDATTGFVIVDNSGNVLAKFKSDELGKAERAYQGSKINIAVDFEVPALEAPKGKQAALAAA